MIQTRTEKHSNLGKSLHQSARFALACGLAALVGGASGCANTNPSFAIIKAVPLTQMTCVAEPDGVALSGGVLDVSSPSFGATPRYVLSLIAENRIIARQSNSFPVMADPNLVRVERAEISITTESGQAIIPTYRVPVSATIPSANGAAPGIGAVVFEALSPVHFQALGAFFGTNATTMLMSVRLAGKTEGAIDVKTGSFVLPVSLCRGCLFQCLRNQDGGPLEGEPACNPGAGSVDTSSSNCCTPFAPEAECVREDANGARVHVGCAWNGQACVVAAQP